MQTDIQSYTDKQANMKIQRDRQVGKLTDGQTDINGYTDKQAHM